MRAFRFQYGINYYSVEVEYQEDNKKTYADVRINIKGGELFVETVGKKKSSSADYKYVESFNSRYRGLSIEERNKKHMEAILEKVPSEVVLLALESFQNRIKIRDDWHEILTGHDNQL